MPWPITRADLVGELGVEPRSAVDVAWADRCVAGAVRYVERNVPAVELDDEDRQLGAVMLAARLYARRNSPGGVVALGELGATYVARADPDVVRLLGLGAPRVG